MRLSPEKADYLLQIIQAASPHAKVFLFGSRTDDSARGGDIDICIISDEKISGENISRIRIAFFKAFGLQKLDLVNYTHDDDSTFKQIIMTDAIRLMKTE